MLPEAHPEPIVVEIFISGFLKRKGGVVAGCVAHPCDQHLPQRRVDIKEEGPVERGNDDAAHHRFVTLNLSTHQQAISFC